MMGPAEIVAVTVGLLTVGGAIFASGRWVGRLESKGASGELEQKVAQLQTAIEIREKDWARHLSDHRELRGEVNEAAGDARVAMASVHNE